MKEMHYGFSEKGNGGEILYLTFSNNGYALCVVNCRGSHMCAYVTFPEIYKLDTYDDLYVEDCEVHGGFTYLGSLDQYGIDESIKWIGWDYAHWGDYTFNGLNPDHWEKVWKVEEVVEEGLKVLEALSEKKYIICKSEDVQD